MTSLTCPRGLRYAFLFAIFSLLAACGDSGSSSDGAGSSSTVSAGSSPPNPDAAGRYRGVANLVLKILGEQETASGTIIIDIASSGEVTVSDGGSYAVNGSLSGNNVVATVPIDESANGIRCKGSATLSGTVSGNTVSGPISGSAECSQGVLKADADISGDFKATR